MKKQILGLLIVTLLLATLPLATASKTTDVDTLAIKKKTFVSGFILFPPRPALGGSYLYFFAISMRSGQVMGDYDVYRLQPVFVKASYGFHGIAMPGFIMGWFNGPLGLAG